MTLILDPHWRRMDELFSEDVRDWLATQDVIWGQDAPIPEGILLDALPLATALVSANPVVTEETLATAPNLKVVIEVSGAFPDTIDYAACAARGVEVLSCAPGFRSAVAEMGLAMALSLGRGLIREHEAFRRGEERWLEDCSEKDFTLFGAKVGFVGFGQIAQELTRLIRPFQPEIRAYDPWLPDAVAERHGIALTPLADLAGWARVLYVAAVPTAENKGLVGSEVIARMPKHAALIVLSRAHLVDFDAAVAAAADGRITFATDVFPSEPLDLDHALRQLPGVLLSPHRAAAVDRGRQPIGDMIRADLTAISEGRSERQLSVAKAERIASLAGVGDADKVANMAAKRS